MSEQIFHCWPIRIRCYFGPCMWGAWFKWHGVEASFPHCYWIYHLGPIKIIFGQKTAEMFKEHFEKGLSTGLKFEGFTREWMKQERGIGAIHQ